MSPGGSYIAGIQTYRGTSPLIILHVTHDGNFTTIESHTMPMPGGASNITSVSDTGLAAGCCAGSGTLPYVVSYQTQKPVYGPCEITPFPIQATTAAAGISAACTSP